MTKQYFITTKGDQMGEVIDFVSRRREQEYKIICGTQDQEEKREQIKDWKRRYNKIMKSTKKRQL